MIKSDHHYPGSKEYPVKVVLYGQLGTQSFNQFHKILREKAEKGEINYILRHYIKVRTSLDCHPVDMG